MFKHIVDNDIEIRIREVRHSNEIFSLIDKERDHLRKWMAWVDDTKEVADVERSTKAMLQQYIDDVGFSASIWYKGKLAGIVSLMGISWKHKSTSIGYWLGTEFTGKGIMTKVCRDIIDYAFNELDLHRVEIQCAEGNVKSRAIPERLGFIEEGKVRESEYLYDHYVTHIVYGMLRSEWK
ncbi:MAG: RimJ/RimL family protein N-acetyltransferase [Firmicutes bacterium HGW-Firmicutes-5]|nr:MAG: RimJ/RimL family protein N-acetyltransferase [Firmicutes bacterium HGW-Firmicutes-5]